MSEILFGKNLEVMRTYPDGRFDAIVTDPPYGWSFMGSAWDTFKPGVVEKLQDYQETRADRTDGRAAKGFGKADYAGLYDNSVKGNVKFQLWFTEIAVEMLRVLKPGGYLVCFGGPRTYHRLACAIEDAGFEIRDQMQWIFGSGFPKSLNISKAIDASMGEKKVVGIKNHPTSSDRTGNKSPYQNEQHLNGNSEITEPVTDEAKQWNGWGTGLKPAYEPICVARKPLEGTVVNNILKHGTGGINIDASRVPFQNEKDLDSATWGRGTVISNAQYVGGTEPFAYDIEANEKGRWPANVMFNEEAGKLLDEQTGTLTSGSNNTRRQEGFFIDHGGLGNAGDEQVAYGDSGGASRFFYCPKASKAEKNFGLKSFEEKNIIQSNGGIGAMKRGDESYMSNESIGLNKVKKAQNFHPTVKPIELMRYLIKLVLPNGGILLDPFAGSGTTGCAAEMEKVDYVLIDQEQEYISLSEARTKAWKEFRNRQVTQQKLF